MDGKLEDLRQKLHDMATYAADNADTRLIDAQLQRDHKRRQLIDHALHSVLRAWLAENENACDIPESFGGHVVKDTGLMGGDDGHGGALIVRFYTQGSGTNVIRPQFTDRGEYDGYEGEVFLEAHGDWEQAGLKAAIASVLAGM